DAKGGGVLPILVKHAGDSSGGRFVFDDDSNLASFVEALAPQVLTSHKEPGAVHHYALCVESKTRERPYLKVWNYLVVFGVASDDLDTAAAGGLSEQETQALLILDLRVEDLNAALGGRDQLQELLSAVERTDHQRQVSRIELVAVPVGVKEAV